MSINLSANSLNDGSFLDFLIAQFGVHGIPPQSICFEVTETATIDSSPYADFIREGKKIKLLFFTRRFWHGSDHLMNIVKQLPVDYVKIDGMFIVSSRQEQKTFC